MLRLEQGDIASEEHTSINHIHASNGDLATTVAELSKNLNGHCAQCQEILKSFGNLAATIASLKSEIKLLNVDRSALKVEVPTREEQSAEARAWEEFKVRCQIAYSVEFECKYLLIHAMRVHNKAKYYDEYDLDLDFSLVSRAPIQQVEEILRKENPRKYLELSRKIFPKDKRIFYNTLLHLNHGGGQPGSTTLNGSPVTFEMAKQLIDTMTLCTVFSSRIFKPPRNDDLGAVRAEAHRMLVFLKEIREGVELLVDYS